ncbi:MAG TPA: TetR/AcrR family transcriptional regulator [Hyphomicrobiales bacterium]|nr:TetR/AcrR family transcriptional regulator [Hyphomicrobiales bacterium]
MSTAELPAPARGRPRSAAADRAIMDAVLDLVAEGHSIASLSIEAIAKRAGVGKATIYRRWSNLDALLIDAFAADHAIPDSIPMGSIRESLIAVLEIVAGYGRRTAGQVFAALQADASRNPGFRDRYFAQVIEPRRVLLRQLLRWGIERGELRPDIDLEAVREVLIGPMLLHVKHGPFADPLDADLPRRIVDTVLRGIGTAKALDPGQ